MQGKVPKYARFLQPIENGVYKVLGPISETNMSAKMYLQSVAFLSIASFFFLTALLMVQHYLPGGQNIDNMSWNLAINTAVSFATNTNW